MRSAYGGPSRDAGRIRRGTTIALTSLLILAALAAIPTAGAATPEGTSCYTGEAAFEPTIGATSNGTLFMQASFENVTPDGRVKAHQAQGVVRSWGGCDDWQDVSPGAPQAGVYNPPASFDPYVYVDEAADRVFSLDMQGLQCNWLTLSDDHGRTWLTNPVACGQPAGLQDHPTLFSGPPRTTVGQQVLGAVDYPSVTYICVNRLIDTACARSLDGGLSFGPWVSSVFDGCGGLTGHGVVGPDGRAYLAGPGCDDEPLVAVSSDDGGSWTPRDLPTDRDVSDHDVELAVDDAGTLYALWTAEDGRQPVLAISQDHGRSWTGPFEVAPSHVATTSFRDVAAGAPGRIALMFYGTRDGDIDATTPWSGYIVVSTDADAADPTFRAATVNATGDPVARGFCDGDNRCGPHPPHEPTWPPVGFSPPGPGDFLDITIDDEGRPWAAMVDVCNGNCTQAGADEKVGHRAFAGTLTEGPALRGPLEPLPPLSS